MRVAPKVPQGLRAISDEAALTFSFNMKFKGCMLSTKRHVELWSLLGQLLAKTSFCPPALQLSPHPFWEDLIVWEHA